MKHWIERFITRLWNRRAARFRRAIIARALDLGALVSEQESVHGRAFVDQARRAEHIAILGRTGTGKSSLVKCIATQDIESGRGGAYFDIHGDATPFLLATFAAQERILDRDLSEKLIVIEPADPDYSVGLNPLGQDQESDRFLHVAALAQILKQRWQLDTFGARTDELLRNALYVVAANGFTLLEVAPLLGHSAFRASCLKNVSNAEVRQYFEIRYDQASEPMRAAMREPILNKISAFTADPRFRAIVGQQRSNIFGCRSNGSRAVDHPQSAQRQTRRAGSNPRESVPHDHQERVVRPQEPRAVHDLCGRNPKPRCLRERPRSHAF